MSRKQLLTALVAIGLVVGSVPGAALAGVDAGTSATVQADEPDANGTEAATGQQLATVIEVTDDEVSGEVEQASLEAALDDANESERAALLADRAAALRERANDTVAAQADATAAYEAGELSRSEYAQRLAVLASRANTLDRGFERLDDRAADVSALELRAAGYDRDANADARERLSDLTSAGASALLAQYSGEQRGEFEVAVDGGLSIEVENEDGERSREFERERPGNGTFAVNQSEALTAASEPLAADVEGEWRLSSVDRDAEDGVYEFEFAFFGPEMTGAAEVSVDGETGTVFEFVEELEPRERDEANDEDDETGEDEGGADGANDAGAPLSVTLVDGTAAPNATVTLAVSADGEPVEGARVVVGEGTVGETDADGRVTLTLPDADEVEVDAEAGDREGELELRLRSSSAEDVENAEISEKLSVDGSVDNGTVTVAVDYDGEGVAGVAVHVDDERVGTTDADGRLSFAASATDELEVTLLKGAFQAELEFAVGDDGPLSVGEIDVEERDRDDRDERDDDADTAAGEDDADDDGDDDAADDDGDDDAADAEDGEADAEDDSLSVDVVSGDPAPGATVTLEVTDDAPVSGAAVEIDGVEVGTTDDDGRITVTLPDASEVDVDVTDGDREGELEFEFADTESDDTEEAREAEEEDDAEESDDDGGDDDAESDDDAEESDDDEAEEDDDESDGDDDEAEDDEGDGDDDD